MILFQFDEFVEGDLTIYSFVVLISRSHCEIVDVRIPYLEDVSRIEMIEDIDSRSVPRLRLHSSNFYVFIDLMIRGFP